MINYYRSTVGTAWPLRAIVEMRGVTNKYDDRGLAVKAYLECGHYCILTGEAISLREVHCKPCGEETKH